MTNTLLYTTANKYLSIVFQANKNTGRLIWTI